MDSETLAMQNLILRGLVGSTVHGLAIEGEDDRDEMGICVEPPEYVCGLEQFEHYVFRTQPEGVRSRAGDLDLVVYSLRKYARLALRGNPSVLLLMFVPQLDLSVDTRLGARLRERVDLFVSRQAGDRYLGYVRAQRQRLTGERGRDHVPNRPELIERYGFDTKYAMHAVRLGFQGVELLETGWLTLPMKEPARSYCREVRTGRHSMQAVLEQIRALESEIEKLRSGSSLPGFPDVGAVNALLCEVHLEHWNGA